MATGREQRGGGGGWTQDVAWAAGDGGWGDEEEGVREGAGQTLVHETHAPKRISHIQFGLLNAEEVERMSEFQVFSRELFKMPERIPAPNGCLDPRLGVSDKSAVCETCSKLLVDCAGHYGHIKLELPVFHIGYFKHTLTTLQCICKTCSRVLLHDVSRLKYLKRMRNPRGMGALERGNLHKKIVTECKKSTACFNEACYAVNGTVKKVTGSQTLKLVHDCFKGKAPANVLQELTTDMEAAAKGNREISKHLGMAMQDLSALRVLHLFQRMTDEDAELLWMDARVGRPENLIIENLLVPPVPIRPSVAMDLGGGSNEDDLTVKLQEILDVNASVKAALDNGANVKMIMENWDFLQACAILEVAQYLNGEMPGLPRPILTTKPIRGLCQRLKGKSGRFRGNLSGKRVDFSARTVISPDPNLRVDQVGVPERVAKIMTFPEMVSRYNIEKLRKVVKNGPDVHPGANQVRLDGGDGFVKKLFLEHVREQQSEDLRIGDIVERHMEDGDVVLFNRQPSLHKMSIMSHRAKIMPWRTFRFNECVCSPYNADFDGDEMNMHLPQTEEARAEASQLMAVPYNLVTPRNGEPLVAATQDFLTAAYLITQRDIFFDRETFCRVASYLGDAGEHVDVPLPAILKPVALWTGKQAMSLMVRPSKENNILVNFESKEKNYKGKQFLCPSDGYVCYHNSELMCGNLAKKTLGDGSKTGLFYTLIREHGPLEAARCMNRLAKVCARYLGGHRGFSIGIEDVTPGNELSALKQELLSDGYMKADEQIRLFNDNRMPLKPGCDPIQSLESELNGLLGKLRETAGTGAMQALPWVNSPRIMAECGSKGSPLNISQMIACVGQQSVGGKRIQNGFVNRTLPHFEANSLFPAAKGFVANSFYSGLTATEFFFHTMGGREGLVDTAVKTAETGYMARRLMKALEDLSMQYDRTVRNSEQTIIQFVYGDDGLNPSCMEANMRVKIRGADDFLDVGQPVDYAKLMTQVTSTNLFLDEKTLSPPELRELCKNILQGEEFQKILPQGQRWTEELKEYLEQLVATRRGLREGLHLPTEAPATAVGTASWRSEKLGPAGSAKFKSWWDFAGVEGAPEESEAGELVVSNTCRVTASQLREFLRRSLDKYKRALVEPGEASLPFHGSNAIGAQSISEPGTQMTLKTFHFAGVASMNVTLGVPRLKEIINASKNISTPIITAKLVQDDSKTSARVVKAKIEKTTLGQVAVYMKEVFSASECFIAIKLDMHTIQDLHLDVNVHTVRHSILKGSFGETRPRVLRDLKPQHVVISGGGHKIKVMPPELTGAKSARAADTVRPKTFFVLQALKAVLPGVIVQGIPSVNRAVINVQENSSGSAAGTNNESRYHLLVEGYGLAAVMGAPGIDGTRTRSNHIIEVFQTLGVEAARIIISEEITYIMKAYGISIDRRHLLLLADVMTFKGEVLGITRFGVSKMRESVLMLASFEKTTDHLFDASVHGRHDAIVGVSECIIMGIPIPLGTGLFKLLMNEDRIEPPPTPELLVG
ncbi:unnamed protein product [Pylaiella littoralis]